MKKQPGTKRENPPAKILFIGIAVAASFWVFDAVVDTFIFKEGGFAGNLLYPEAIELWMRLVVVGMIIGISVYAKRTITRRKLVDKELRQSEKSYRTLLETIPHGIQENDTSGIITFSNRAHCEMNGYKEGELEGTAIWDFFQTEEERESLRQYLKKIVREKPQPTPYFARNQTKDGRSIDVQVDWNYKLDSEGNVVGFVSVITDITERKRLEEEKEKIRAHLFREQHLEALGLLAGGVAHHFKNLLNSVKGYSELMMMEIKSSEPWYEYFKRILSSVESAVEISDRLYFFARKKSVDFCPVNINNTVEDLLRMLNPIIGRDVKIITELEPGLWTTRADEGSIEEAIMNLVVNAKDAMKGTGGGEVTIKTENVTLNKARSKALPQSRPGRFVLLSVVDTGVGMDTEHMEKVFEPFFTTKDIGEGTGLGLSFVYGVAKQHDGWVNAYSEQGKGAAFKIYLPAIKGKPEKSEKTEGKAEKPVPSGTPQ